MQVWTRVIKFLDMQIKDDILGSHGGGSKRNTKNVLTIIKKRSNMLSLLPAQWKSRLVSIKTQNHD